MSPTLASALEIGLYAIDSNKKLAPELSRIIQLLRQFEGDVIDGGVNICG